MASNRYSVAGVAQFGGPDKAASFTDTFSKVAALMNVRRRQIKPPIGRRKLMAGILYEAVLIWKELGVIPLMMPCAWLMDTGILVE